MLLNVKVVCAYTDTGLQRVKGVHPDSSNISVIARGSEHNSTSLLHKFPVLQTMFYVTVT